MDRKKNKKKRIIALGADHAGYDVKEMIKKHLKTSNDILDYGTNNSNSVDYPIYGQKVGLAVAKNIADCGIIICGSGIGISIAANKVKNVRAALCTSTQHAEMSRRHNDANVLAIGARMTDYKQIISIIDKWLNTKFEGGRHQNRIDKIEF